MTRKPTTALEAVTHPDPYPYYAELAARPGLVRDAQPGMLVAASAEAVAASLASELVRVRPVAEPVPPALVGSAAGALFVRLMRMTDGAGHDALKAATAGLDELANRAAALTRDVAPALLHPSRLESLWEFALAVPAHVIGQLLGLGPADLDATRGWVDDLVASFGGAAPAAQGGAAADRLAGLVGASLGRGPLAGFLAAAERGGCPHAATVANAVGFLTQAHEATAALIGQTLVALARHPAPRPRDLVAVVREVARHDAPVHNTRRFVARPGTIAGSAVEPGDTVLVVLAAANRDPRVNPTPDVFDPQRRDPILFTFGLGGHACPGAALAVAIAAAAAEVVVASGLDLVPLAGGVRYRPLPNIRMPGGFA